MPEHDDIVILDKGFTRNQSRTSPAISTARAKMSANELKAFYQISTLVKQDDTDFLIYEISSDDFVKKLGFSETNDSYIKDLCRGLLKQIFEIERPDGTWEAYSIFSSFKFKPKVRTITVRFNDEMKPFLLELTQYTKIHQVEYIRQFESKYAIRIYALLKDYRLLSYRDIEIEALKKMLVLPKSYKDFTDISRFVLMPAVKEINAKSDLEIYSIDPIEKQGKKIVRIRVNFGNKADKQANQIMKYLEQRYKRSSQDPSVFYGFYYSISDEPRSKGEIFRITKIEADSRPYFTAFSEKQTLFAVLGKKEFMKRLLGGIYKALIFMADTEKRQSLDLDQWQNEQDKITQMKRILDSWGKGLK